MKTKVYIETTIPSYLTPRNPARLDAIRAGHCMATLEWWQNYRQLHQCFVSQIVLDEAAEGDPSLAEQRLRHLRGIPILDAKPEVLQFAEVIQKSAILPPRAVQDVFHLSYAIVHRMDFLLTWNLKHINNPFNEPKLRQLAKTLSLPFPVICTPEVMLSLP